MFSIYGVTGQIFTGKLEEMNRVRPVASAVTARTIAPKDHDMGEEAANRAAHQPHEEDVRAYLNMLPREIERGPLYHANQIMQLRVITVSAGDDMAHAWRTLCEHKIHQAPVLNENAQLVGIVSERDLLTAINMDAGQIDKALSRHVRDVMTTPVVAAAPVTDIRHIAAVMLDHGVDGTPITNDSGHLVGFISRSDILRAVVTDPPLSLWR